MTLSQYIIILKAGNSWSVYLGTESGSMSYITTVTNADLTSTPYLTLRAYGPNATSTPGNPIMGWSGLEFLANATDLP